MAFHDSHVAHAPLLGPLHAVHERIRAAYARHVEYARVRDELERFDDRELTDLGISRADIPRLAREAAQTV